MTRVHSREKRDPKVREGSEKGERGSAAEKWCSAVSGAVQRTKERERGKRVCVCVQRWWCVRCESERGVR